jgi:hypothetical protein
MRENCLQNPFAILQHLVVPKAKHLPALARQISVTDSVTKAFRVLRAVSLDDQLSANTKKVDNVGADRNLPAKLEPAEATIAQKTPESELAVGRGSAHRSGAGALVRRDARVGLHRLSIGGAALIRRAFGAPPSPRGRRGLPALTLGLSAEEKARSAPLLPRGEGGPKGGRMRVLGSRLRKRPAVRGEFLQ